MSTMLMSAIEQQDGMMCLFVTILSFSETCFQVVDRKVAHFLCYRIEIHIEDS